MTTAPEELAQRTLRGLGRGLGYLLLLLAGCAAAMTIGYRVVLHAARNTGRTGVPVPAAFPEAVQLGDFSDELLALTREYLDRLSREPSPPSEQFTRWAAHEFSPRVNDLRRRLHRVAPSGEALTTLLAAADRVHAMAAQPGQARLRERAMEEVLDATAAVEGHVAAVGKARPDAEGAP